MKISNKEYQKYSKQIILKKFGLVGQKKIINSKVLIFGMGGLGCPLAIYLASLGIGTLGIVDNDKIELSNLNRQIIYTNDDIGKFKVDVAQKKIKKINSKSLIKSYRLRAGEKNIRNLIKNFDIICDGTDNFVTRLLINDHCFKQKKILISAAVSGFTGHIFKFDFREKTPCFRCYMPEIPNLDKNCETEGVTPTITGTMGTLQANEVLNSVLDLKSGLKKQILIFNSLEMSFRKVKLNINNKCVNKC